MSRAIWKFTLGTTDRQLVEMPTGAMPLTVQIQGGHPQLWALVDPEAAYERCEFTVYGTGHQMPDDPGAYIGTYQLHGGALVFHVFKSTGERLNG